VEVRLSAASGNDEGPDLSEEVGAFFVLRLTCL
jgi:hypothetical protein